MAISQPKDKQEHPNIVSLKYKHSKKNILYEKINGSLGWNKHFGEQYESKTQ